jgi:hypothetical protein
MHACWILLCMSLKSFLLCILKFQKVFVRERIPREGLKVACPDLWVSGYVTNWYQSFWFKQWVGMGWVFWLESRGYRLNSDCGVENLRRNGVAESTHELDHQRSVVRG